MHMSDALITPLVGGSMLFSSIGVLRNSSKRLELDFIEERLPYMGLVGAFVFASQMINFAIPGTGSSGHIGGGILLAILLGPHAGFIAMASILLVQALFFADGGLLAYGCNLFNLGFFTCYVAYPLIYKPILKKSKENGRDNKKYIYIGAILATVVGLQLGSFGVVVETVLSGRTDLPFNLFLSFMQPIHLAIGLVEGIITATIVVYLYKHRSDLHYDFFKTENNSSKSRQNKAIGKILLLIIFATVLVGGVFSLLASSNPDGLEWAIENISAHETKAIEPIKAFFLGVQESFAFLPDYGFKDAYGLSSESLGTSTSGIIGSLMTLMLAVALGKIFTSIRKKNNKDNQVERQSE